MNKTNRDTLSKIREALEDAKNDYNSNYHLIRRDIDKYGGKFVDIMSSIGILICAVAEYYDYYWVIYTAENKLKFITCCAKIELLDKHIIKNTTSLQELKKLQQDNPKYILDRVNELLQKETESIVFTDLKVV